MGSQLNQGGTGIPRKPALFSNIRFPVAPPKIRVSLSVWLQHYCDTLSKGALHEFSEEHPSGGQHFFFSHATLADSECVHCFCHRVRMCAFPRSLFDTHSRGICCCSTCPTLPYSAHTKFSMRTSWHIPFLEPHLSWTKLNFIFKCMMWKWNLAEIFF